MFKVNNKDTRTTPMAWSSENPCGLMNIRAGKYRLGRVMLER